MYPNTPCPECPNCPTTVTPLPLPDFHGLCGDTYDLSCVQYTGEDVRCLGITSGMMITEILAIFQTAAQGCGCCVGLPQPCVLSDWGPWGQCNCEYDEDTSVATCTETRTRTIITPPSFGGTACGPLSEERTSTLQPVCFTFGSYICESDPDGTQVLAPAICYYNGKPYYEFDICGHHQVIWFDTTDNLWHHNATLGVSSPLDDTLDNNGNFYPISNNTTQIWHISDDQLLIKGHMDLVSSNLNTCPDYKICFHTHITLDEVEYDFYNYVPPYYIETLHDDHATYSYHININSNEYTVIVNYDPAENAWFANSAIPGILDLGTLPDASVNPAGILPLGTWVPEISDSYIVTTSLNGPCIQPEDVDCVVEWGEWGPCIGGTETRTGTIITPASGNGAPCPSLIESRPCGEPPYCFPPTDVTITLLDTSVIVSFTGVIDASTYTASYTTDGTNYTTVTGSGSPITLTTAYTCGLTYSGWIVTNCSNGLTSSQVPFTITIPDCPPAPLPCDGSIVNIISGNFTSQKPVLLKIDSSTGAVDSSKIVLDNNPLPLNTTQYWTNELAFDGLYLAGLPTITRDPIASFYSGGILKLKCAPSSSPDYFVEIDRKFVTATGANAGFGSATGGQGLIRALKYDHINNRLYVGGTFTTYKGVQCSQNLVCLDATSGNIIPNTIFKIGVAGIYGTSNSGGTGSVFDIQIDGNGKIVVAGSFEYYASLFNVYTPVKNILRLNFDGTLDPTFAVSPTSFSPYIFNPAVTFYPNMFSLVKTIYIDSNNDIYAGGGFYQYNNQEVNHIVKIKNNGTKASLSEFNSGMGFLNVTLANYEYLGWYKAIAGVELANGLGGSGLSIEKIVPHMGKLLITGNFASYNNDVVNTLVRINLDGSIDGSFVVDTESFDPSYSPTGYHRSGLDVKVLSNNNILLGGYLSNYNNETGTSSYYVLSDDGSVLYGSTISGSQPFFVKTIASQLM